MSGRSGFLGQMQIEKIESARRTLRDIPCRPEAPYTEALDRFAADVYGAIGLKAPKVYRFDSPLASILAIPHIRRLHSSAVSSDLLTDLRNVLGVSLSPGMSRSDVGPLLGSSIALPLEEQISDLFKNAFIRQMKDQCGLNEKASLALMARRGEGEAWWSSIASGTWVWPYDGFAVACDQPLRIETDERGRTHGENDAAIEFADSYRVWAWHGVLVPKHVILFPEALGFDNVEKERNLEIRRIMIERVGPGKYLRQAGAVLEDMDTLTLDGSAPRALMKDKLGNKWLVGTDGSTARVYTMAVPENVKTCKEAHEMIAGFDESRLIAEA